MLTYYHGTSDASAQQIMQSVDLNQGGGELGQGFYVGSSMWRACSWAWQKANRNYAVLEFSIYEPAFLNLNLLCLNRQQTLQHYKQRRRDNTCGTYIYKRENTPIDAVWAPIVGRGIKDTCQIKFQGATNSPAAVFINNQQITRII